MNKSDLVGIVAQKTGTTKKSAEAAVSAVFDVITAALEQGEKVQISNFGVFEVKTREARVGRNPRTGVTVEIPATRQPSFKASKILKDTVGE